MGQDVVDDAPRLPQSPLQALDRPAASRAIPLLQQIERHPRGREWRADLVRDDPQVFRRLPLLLHVALGHVLRDRIREPLVQPPGDHRLLVPGDAQAALARDLDDAPVQRPVLAHHLRDVEPQIQPLPPSHSLPTTHPRSPPTLDDPELIEQLAREIARLPIPPPYRPQTGPSPKDRGAKTKRTGLDPERTSLCVARLSIAFGREMGPFVLIRTSGVGTTRIRVGGAELARLPLTPSGPLRTQRPGPPWFAACIMETA